MQKVVKPCPTCKADIADFLANCQVNRCCSLLLSIPAGNIVAVKLSSYNAGHPSRRSLHERMSESQIHVGMCCVCQVEDGQPCTQLSSFT